MNSEFTYRQIFICVAIIILLICTIYYHQSKSILTYNEQPICVNKDTYDKMLDIITNYSLMSNDRHKKLILIYLSTFHLFDMNYDIKSIQKLDDRLANQPYEHNNVYYPEGTMYHNLQKTIITHLTKYLDDIKLNNNKQHDKIIINVFMNNLFNTLKILC